MLSKILKKSDCAACRFCCSFRRQSLWETPVFDAESVEKLRKLYPHAKFRNEGTESFTFDISDQYKTSRSEEEAPCPFLDAEKGCVLPPELKPFDCSIWPFRAVRLSGVADAGLAASANCGQEAASVWGGTQNAFDDKDTPVWGSGQKASSNCGQEASSVSGGRDGATSVSGGRRETLPGAGQAALAGGTQNAPEKCEHKAASVWGGGQDASVNGEQPAFESGNPAATAYDQPPEPAGGGQIAVALTPTCPAINRVSRQQITELLNSGLGEKILAYAETHPDIIKEPSEFLSDIVYKRKAGRT